MISLFSITDSTGLNFSFVRANDQKNEALERLSTGKRINRAADDPSGLIAAENLRADTARIQSQIKSGERALTWLGATDGALGVVGDLLIQLDGLIVTAANTAGLGDGEREAIRTEIDGVLDAIDFTNSTARFNDQQILGGFGTFQMSLFVPTEGSGDDDPDHDSDRPKAVDEDGSFYRLADLRSGGRLDLFGEGGEVAQDIVEAAQDRVSGARGAAGARSRAVESELNERREALINTTGALSRVEDADFAAEAAKLVRAQLLEQASLSAILIGRQSAESVLALLAPASRTVATQPQRVGLPG
ncbi:MAG: flagellin [Planctomycetota bacterium]